MRKPAVRLLIFIAAAALVLIGAVVLPQIQRANQPITWLSDQNMVGVCEAAESLAALRAVRVDLPDGIGADRALTAARDALTAQYPNEEASEVALSRPLLVQAVFPIMGTRPAYLVVARLHDASPADTPSGAAAILYIDALQGSLLYTVTALNATIPQIACF